MIPLLATLLGIGLVLFVHEAGHFLAARAAGVRVDVFSLGFGPRVIGFKRGDTDYRLSLLPLGGYVRMRGDEDSPAGAPRPGELHAASPMWRLLIYSGGILMNFLFAFLLVPLLFTIGLPFEAPVVGMVPAGTPAWEAGMRSGDRILEIDGRETHGFRNFATGIALSALDEAIDVRIERDGAEQVLTLDPEYDTARGFRRVGVAPATDVLAMDGGLAAAAGVPSGTLITHIDGVSLADPLTAQVMLDRLVTGDAKVTLGSQSEGDVEMRTWELQLAPQTVEGAPNQLGVVLLQDTVISVRGELAELLQPGDRLLRIAAAPNEPAQPVDGIASIVRATLAFGHLPELTVVAAGESPESESASVAGGTTRVIPAQEQIDVRAIADQLQLGSGDVERLSVREGSAAALAGLKTGDAVLRVGNSAVHDFEALRGAVQSHGESTNAEKPLTLSILRGDTALEVQVSLAPIPMNDLGLALAPRQEIVRSDNFIDAIGMGMEEARRMTMEVMLTLKRMVSGEIDHRNLGGIISIGQVTHSFASQGILPLLFFLCMISVNLGVLNLLPIPALDGGHILLVLIEKLRGRPVSIPVQNAFNLVGVVLVLGLIVFVTTMDINRLLGS